MTQRLCKYLQRLRHRMQRTGHETPSLTVRFDHFQVIVVGIERGEILLFAIESTEKEKTSLIHLRLSKPLTLEGAVYEYRFRVQQMDLRRFEGETCFSSSLFCTLDKRPRLG